MKAVKRGRKKVAKASGKREDALRATFVEILLKTPLKNVKFSNDKRISAEFFGEKFSYRVVVKREPDIADWSRKRKEIYIDRQIATKDRFLHTDSFKALCVHEAVEKFVVEKFGLKVDEEAHIVATKKERQYLKKIGGSWRSHQALVYRKWKKPRY